MCKPKSEGGKRCASHVKERLTKLAADKDALQNRIQHILSEPESTSTENDPTWIQHLRDEVELKEIEIEKSRLDYAGTRTGQEELEAAIVEAREKGDDAQVRHLRVFAERARRHTEEYMERNIREYKLEEEKQAIRDEYLPEVYRKGEAGEFPDRVPSGGWTHESIERERYKLQHEQVESRRAQYERRIALGEEAHAFYQKWIPENYKGSPIPLSHKTRAELAAKVAEEDYGNNSPQAIAAYQNAALIRNAYRYQESFSAQEYNKRIHAMGAQNEIERQQIAIHKGEILTDARFINDSERHTSPHGVQRRDVGRAGIEVENAKKLHGKESPEYLAAVKNKTLVEKAYATRRDILRQQKLRDRIGRMFSNKEPVSANW